MIKKYLFAFLFAVALSGMAGSTSAAIVYDNGTADLGDRLPGGRGAGYVSDFDLGTQAADDFTLGAGASTVTDIHWWGAYSPNPATPPADDFTVRIFAQGTSGLPLVTPLHEINAGSAGRTATGDQIRVEQSSIIIGEPPTYDTFDVYKYWVDIAPLPLVAGTRYWLSVVNNTTANPDHDWMWVHSATGNATDNVFRFSDAEAWFVSANSNARFDLAFNLTGDITGNIPEPSTLAIFGLGLAGLGFMRRRKLC